MITALTRATELRPQDRIKTGEGVHKVQRMRFLPREENAGDQVIIEFLTPLGRVSKHLSESDWYEVIID